MCECGHRRPAHVHYRAGNDCGLCSCRGFTRRILAPIRRRFMWRGQRDESHRSRLSEPR